MSARVLVTGMSGGCGERLWRADRVGALLTGDGPRPGHLFVSGTTRNQVDFSPRFDHVVLLSAPAAVLVGAAVDRELAPVG